MPQDNISHYERELLLAHILGVSREHVLARPDIRMTLAQSGKFKESLKRRRQNEPLAYILGHKGFYGLDFKVNPDTLIPRPETEMLVEAAKEELASSKGKVSLIDVGSGSGNIIISVAVSMKDKKDGATEYYGLDISSGALKVARYNSKKYQLEKRIKFIRSDLLEYFLERTHLLGSRCIIVSNLPYLSEKIYGAAMPDVKNFEPGSALVSGQDGLDHYTRLFLQISKLKEKNPSLQASCCIEIGPEQKKETERLIKMHFSQACPLFRKDLAHKWRFCMFKL